MTVRRLFMSGLVATAALLPLAAPASAAQKTEEAVLGGGCFWCVEAPLEELKGVKAVVNGYAGGTTVSPSYEAVCSGKTGHAEVVKVTFDPAVISYKDLLRAFFVVHDPTTKNRQGNDVGSQYRSVIFTADAAQEQTARAVIAEMVRSKAFGKPIVTEVKPMPRFYLAEDYHQDYFARNPNQPYCAFVVAPKVEKLRQKFVDKLKR